MINSDQRLKQVLPKLREAAWVAVDTEADSLHAYPEKLCLLQVSTEGDDFLFDPLSHIDLGPVLEALAKHEIILHGADYDLRLLRKRFGFVPSHIFDTMIAARLLGCREFGLTSLVSKYLGVKLEKGPQKANWAKRPLTPRMEAYARNDTRHLKPLVDILRAQLEQAGRLEWHRETCLQLIAECAAARPVDRDLVWRVKGSHRLRPAALAVLRELWYWRENEAIAANRPPYFILPPELMVTLASAATESDSVIDLLPRHLPHRRQRGVLEAVAQGLASEDPPAAIRRKGYRQTEQEKLRLHALEGRRNKRANELGIDPSLIASRATLALLARDWKSHEHELLQWQKELLQP